MPANALISTPSASPAQGEAHDALGRNFPLRRRLALAYTTAVVLPLVILSGRIVMGFKPGDAPMLILFIIPAIVSAYLGGLKPGLAATVFSGLVTDYFLLRPAGGTPLVSGFQSTQWQALMAEGALISVLTEALHLARQRFHAILESALDAIVVINDEGRIVEFNPAAERMFGHAAAAMLGRNISEVIVLPAVRARDRTSLARYLAAEETGGLGRRTELVALRADGKEFTVEVSLQRIEGVYPPLFTGFIRDITERQRAEAALRRSEAILAQAQRIAHIGSWDLDLTNLDDVNVNPLRWSEELFRLFGYEPGSVEVSNEFFFRHVPPDDRDRIKVAVAETLRSGLTYSLDHRIILPDGTERVIHEQADLIREEKTGRPLRMVGTAQDVTDRRRAERELLHREERFRRLIENASDIITLLDEAGIIRFQSPSTPRVLGYAPEEMIGRPSAEFIHPEDCAKVGEAMQQTLTGRELPVPVEYRIRHRDGSWRIHQSFGKSMLEPDGAKLIVVNSRDVTESRQLEEQFRQSQKMEAIGQLSGGVAHDFNNLLSVIKGYIGLLEVKGQVSPEISGSIQQISEAADRATNLVRQLLTFSRNHVMQLAEHNLNGLVINLAKMLRRLLSENIEMLVDCAPDALPIRADEGMVEQVLLNLVVNARDAMPKGGILRITTKPVDFAGPATPGIGQARPGAFVCLAVSDTGTGIAPEILPRIFEPFYTTKAEGEGTGLGLATVYGIMQQHDGWVSVESEVGRGTTFQAYFPRLASASVLKPANLLAAAVRGGHEGILLVEDEASVRKLAEVALTGLGYRVFSAHSGSDALQVWQAHKHIIELLLTDMVMPDRMTGRELALRLRSGNPKLPIIYMSGYNAVNTEGDFQLQELTNYLPKPFDVIGLAKIVRASLDRGATQAPFARPPG